MKNPLTAIFGIIFIFTFTSCNIFGTHKDSNADDPDGQSLKILFIGSSYFNWHDLPNMIENLANRGNKNVEIHSSIQSGLFLDDHVNRSITNAKIIEKQWDFVVLQGVGSVTAYPDFYPAHPVYSALKILNEKIKENSDSTNTVFCMPWAFEDGMAWKAGWTDDYSDMQKKIYDKTLEFTVDPGVSISPVGWAWNTILSENNFPLHYLHESDWNHPSKEGTYVMACVIYSTLFQETTVGLTYYGGISENEAKYIQEVASSTVLDSLELWNIK